MFLNAVCISIVILSNISVGVILVLEANFGFINESLHGRAELCNMLSKD